MTTLRILSLSLGLLLAIPPVLAERGFTGLRIGPNSTAMDVFQNAPAWQAGVRPGDVIEYVDNISTRNMQPQELSDRITGPIGTKVTLIIVRGGKRYTCVVVRGSSKAATEAASAALQLEGQRNSEVYTGLEIDDGNRIANVDMNSPAWKVGLRAGDRIELINSSPTKDMSTQAVVHRVVHPVNTIMQLRIARGVKQFDVNLSGGPRPVAAPVQKKTPVAASSSAQGAAPPIVAIEIFKQSSETDKTVKQVKEALAKVPQRVQQALKTSGIEVMIVPNLLAVRPEFAKEKPKGLHSSTLESCAGLFYPQEKKVYICEKVTSRNNPGQENLQLIAAVIHEVGHAFDATGDFSKADSFVKAFADDGKHLGNDQRNKFEYFLKENDAGHSEMFAEQFQAICSPRSERAISMSNAFPKCAAAVREAVGSP